MENEFDEAHIAKIFSMFDKDNDGLIQAKEVGAVIRLIGKNPTNEEVQNIVKKMDPTNTGFVSYESFLNVFAIKELINESTKNELRAAFRVFDREGQGYITLPELRHILLHLGEKLSEDEFQDIVREGNLERNGKVWYDDIITLILSR